MSPSSWFAIAVLAIVANTLITIYLFPKQAPDYWWLPGAWIWFLLKEYLFPVDSDPTDPNKRRRVFNPPRIA